MNSIFEGGFYTVFQRINLKYTLSKSNQNERHVESDCFCEQLYNVFIILIKFSVLRFHKMPQTSGQNDRQDAGTTKKKKKDS